MTHTEEVAVSRAEELRLVFAERDRLRERNAELVKALEAAFVSFGRAGGNTLNGPFRQEWEMCRAALAKSTT